MQMKANTNFASWKSSWNNSSVFSVHSRIGNVSQRGFSTGKFAKPPQNLQFIKGKSIDFTTAFKNAKPLHVLEFWATWCPPCRTSIPHLSSLQKKYKETVKFVGITNEEEKAALPFVQQMGDNMDYTVAIDTEDTVFGDFNVTGIPAAFLIGKNGEIFWQGHPMDPSFEKAIQSHS